MSEYYMTHTGAELDEAISKVKSGYVMPAEIINIVSNVSNMDITNGKTLNVNVPVPDGYVRFTEQYHETFSQSSENLNLSRSFTCGFRPKVVLVSIGTDTTVSTTYTVIFAFRATIGNLSSVGDGLYKAGSSNRVGSFGGAITINDNGFTYSHNTIGLGKNISYDIYAWG